MIRGSAVVDVSSVSQANDDHEEDVILDGVDDPVVPDTKSEGRPSPERAGVGRVWVLGQERYRPSEPLLNLGVELSQGSCCVRTEFDPVALQSHPRSALTCSQGMFAPSSDMASSNAVTSSISSSAFISSS